MIFPKGQNIDPATGRRRAVRLQVFVPRDGVHVANYVPRGMPLVGCCVDEAAQVRHARVFVDETSPMRRPLDFSHAVVRAWERFTANPASAQVVVPETDLIAVGEFDGELLSISDERAITAWLPATTGFSTAPSP